MNELFKNKGIKLTKQRNLVLEEINMLNNNATLKNIVTNCSKKTDKSTVYRILDLFLNKEIVRKNLNINGEIYFEILPTIHAHYINCIKCHKKIEIDKYQIEIFEKNVLKNFTMISHNVEFYGICTSCQSK